MNISDPAVVLGWAYVGHTVFYVQTYVDLMQHNPQIIRFRVTDHHEFEAGWRFIVMKLVVSRPVRYEAAVPKIRIVSNTHIGGVLTYRPVHLAYEPYFLRKRPFQR